VRIDGVELAMPALTQPLRGDSFVLGVRPEHISLDQDAPLRASVYGTEYLGTMQILTLTLQDGTLLKARVPSGLPVNIGDGVGLRLATPRLSLFAQHDGGVQRSHLHESASPVEAVHG
jgi:multiple sugar transport system ATP-binding protein